MTTQLREELTSVDQARDIILKNIHPLETEVAGVINALGKTTAEDVVAPSDVPATPNATVDGFAVISADTKGAAEGNPAKLKVAFEIPAGSVTEKTIVSGTAAYLRSGTAMPKGADAVVSRTHCIREDVELHIMKEVRYSEHVKPAGGDVKKGDVVISEGTLIGPAQLGMLAALGKPGVAVSRKPRVAVITTGSELVDIVDEITAGQIRNSSRYSIVGQVLASGCELGPLLHAREGKDSMYEAVSKALRADAIITSGGVSLGEHDLMRETIGRMGTMHVSRVAAKQCKPFYFATIESRPLFALPGNAGAAMVAFEVFVRPALLKMLGRTSIDRAMVTAQLKSSIEKSFCNRQFIRARTVWESGGYTAEAINDQSSGLPKSALQANSIIVVREDRDDLRRGDMVEVMLLDSYYQG